MPELIMISVVLMMLTIPVGIVIALVWYYSSRSKQTQPTQPPQVPKNIQERLSEIDYLRSQNLISETEYEEGRRYILNGI